jgi:predicted O-methyltransferase YrrM
MSEDSSHPAFDPAWSLRPEGLALLERLVGEGRSTVVECGSGLSTVTIARALGGIDAGHVHSLEHVPAWAAVARAALAAEDLDELATVIDAPLIDGWYDPAALDRLPERGIDLLLVDGPPAGGPAIQESRYRALPAIAERLAPNAAVVLDDADREGERRVLVRWLAEFPLRLDRAPAGLALAVYVPEPAGTGWTTIRRGRHERNS